MISIFTGVSGLRVHERAVDVIANNIANINTVAFKSGRTSFQEALVQTLRGGSESGTNPMQMGLGAELGSIANIMGQGSLRPTGSPTDLAIVGDGFFMVSDGQTIRYTRDGTMQLDGQNRLVAASSGMSVSGWSADPVTGAIDNTAPINPASEIIVPLGTMYLARQTSNVVYRACLDSSAADGTAVDTTYSVFDSLGAAHQVTVTFTKTAVDGEWDWAVTSPDGTSASTGTLVFDENGTNTTPSAVVSLALTDSLGAVTPMDFNLDMSAVMQLSGTSSLQVINQDGLGPGTLESFNIDNNGVVIGVFNNGMTQSLGQIALARVSNSSGMSRLGGNLYELSSNTGAPSISPPGPNAGSTLVSGALEMSNVDLANEFANLIIMQRGFQANSRVITTGDEMLQDLLTLKR
jgi:flagellar hook protein FlgE